MTKILFSAVFFLARLQESISVLISRLGNKFVKKKLANKKNQELYREILLPVIDRHLISSSFEHQLKKLELAPPDSFKSLIRVSRGKSNSSHRIEWKLNHKTTGSNFARSFGFNTPEVFQLRVPLQEIRFRKNVVIKPITSSGSVGVYIYHNNNKIWDIKNEKYLNELETLTTTIEKLLGKNKFKDSWIVEEYISNSNGLPQRDFKFYTFYGEVMLIQETEIISELRYCYWDRKLNIIEDVRTDKYKSFVGDGLDPDYIKKIRSI